MYLFSSICLLALLIKDKILKKMVRWKTKGPLKPTEIQTKNEEYSVYYHSRNQDIEIKSAVRPWCAAVSSPIFISTVVWLCREAACFTQLLLCWHHCLQSLVILIRRPEPRSCLLHKGRNNILPLGCEIHCSMWSDGKDAEGVCVCVYACAPTHH